MTILGIYESKSLTHITVRLTSAIIIDSQINIRVGLRHSKILDLQILK